MNPGCWLSIRSFPPRQRRVRSVLSPRCAGAAARRAVLSPPHYLSGWCVSPAHISPHWDLGFFSQDPSEGSSLFPNYLGKLESADFADVTERSQDLRVHNSFFVRREPHLRRPGQKLLSFWVWLVVRSRDRATPPTCEVRERLPDNEHEHRIQEQPRSRRNHSAFSTRSSWPSSSRRVQAPSRPMR